MTASLDGFGAERFANGSNLGGRERTAESRHDGPYVSIVLPCYNEQDHVVAEVTRICAAMDTSGYTYELLAFDDASTDETLARLYEAAPQLPAAAGRALPPQRRLGHRAPHRHPARPAARSSCGPTPT